ncbi:MAG TPA: hypothetical protein VGR28_13145 [Candidatus Thermoplasmatota archaeon]|jgi:hypothetical protein|nr:hypothetical protein [Candidatus Thermoplasmatota archaeon]
MRAAFAAFGLALLLALPALPAPAREATELSHEAIAPYMHLAALNLPAGIRPGAWLQLGPADCTASFVVRDASGALYITTASHCTHALGERVKYTSNALIAAQAPPTEFGTVVARWPQGYDAALIKIDAAKYGDVSPRMIGWGGPTGLATSAPAADTQVLHYGWGWWTWMDHTTRCRIGVMDSFDSQTWWYDGPVGNGDSGSAVMTEDGLALGVLDWGSSSGLPLLLGPPAGPYVFLAGGGTRFDRALAAWEAVTGLDLELVTGGPVNATCDPELPV